MDSIDTRVVAPARRPLSDRAGADGLDRPRAARLGGVERRRPRHHRDVVGRARRGEGRDPARCATSPTSRSASTSRSSSCATPASSTSSSRRACEFVTTSAGDPRQYTAQLKDAGLTVFHVVPSLDAALKAVDAGVDGLVVEGGEGGGFKNPRDVATMVLLPLVRSKVDVPIIAAGGICDGPTMAAAFALGAEGVQMGIAHGVGGRVAGARELEAGDRRRGGDRHGLPEPLHAGPACARCAPQRTERLEREEHVGMDVFGARHGPLLRRRHGGGDRARRPGRRPHRRGEAGGADHRGDGGGLPADDRPAGGRRAAPSRQPSWRAGRSRSVPGTPSSVVRPPGWDAPLRRHGTR